MTPKFNFLLSLGSSLAFFSLSSCALEPPITVGARTSAQWNQELGRLIGDAGCDNTAQCRSIAIGAKACGGPSRFLAWSTRSTDEAALKTLVAKQATSQSEESRRSGVVSDCAVVTDPGASCQAGRCVLSPQLPSGGQLVR